MDKDIKDRLIDEAKNNMPDLWGKIEVNLKDKKPRRNRGLIGLVAALTIVVAIGGVSKKFDTENEEKIMADSLQNEEKNAKDNKEENNKIAMLDDLELDAYMKDKICIGGGNSTAYIEREIDYKRECESVIYGKITKVNSYVSYGDRIISDITVDVITDYKNIFKEGEAVTFGSNGGELTFETFASQASEEIVSKMTNTESQKMGGYDLERDKNKTLVEFDRDGIPHYREGEYVLVYLKSINMQVTNSHKDDIKVKPPTVDKTALKKLYVDPNTGEVFQYVHNYESNSIIKEKVDTLDNIEDFYKQES